MSSDLATVHADAATRPDGQLGLTLLDPELKLPLASDRPWSLTAGEKRWPVVEGIPFLRVNREDLRVAALEALDVGDPPRALGLLLADQDDFARSAPPDQATLGELIDQVFRGSVTLRDAMQGLRFGPVADYFAYRWSSPTYLSGLSLLDRYAGGNQAGPVVEVACGIGHYLRELVERGRNCLGVDVVFSKLWLARKFVVPGGVSLICADVAGGWPLGASPTGGVAFCHDAFYFLPRKAAVLASLREFVGEGGRILVGHAHNRNHDQGGVAGDPRSPGEYAALMPGCTLFDDAELARSVWSGNEAPGRTEADLDPVEAIALVWAGPNVESPGPQASFLDPVPGTPLRINPLLVERSGHLAPAWPSSRFEAEYAAAAGYLVGEPIPDPTTLAAAARGEVGRGTDPEVDRLARRRIILHLPERW